MKFLLTLFILTLTACGFTPVYTPQSNNSDIESALSTITVDTIPDRSGQVVRNHLIDRLPYDGNDNTTPPYRLVVSAIDEDVVEIGIDRDDEASRAQLRQSATFNLIDGKNQNPVLRRTVRSVSSYNILSGQFTTFITQQDARRQALRTLADDIVTELELYFAQ